MSNWKRLLILALTVSVLSSTICFSVSADEIDNFYDVLAVATANDSGSNTITLSNWNYELTYDLPVNFNYYGLDMVIRISDPNFKMYRYSNGNWIELSSVALGYNMYRIYADGFFASLDPRFKFESSTVNLDVISFSLQTSLYTFYPETGAIMLSTPYQSDTVDMTEPNQAAVINFVDVFDDVGSVQNQGSFIYRGTVVVTDWNKYDFITLQFRVRSTTLDSIIARFGDTDPVNIPFTYSYVNGNSPDYDDYEGSEDVNGVSTVRWVNVTLDLTDIDRNDPYYVYVDFTGTHTHYTTGFVSLVTVAGYVNSKLPNNEIWFLNRIWKNLVSGFESVVSGVSALGDRLVGQLTSFETNITNWIYNISTKIINLHNDLIDWFDKDTSANDQLDQDLVDQESELGDISDSFESVTQPTVGDDLIVLDPNIVSPNALSAITGISNTIFQNEFFLTVFSLSFLFALVSYVLFGKR